MQYWELQGILSFQGNELEELFHIENLQEIVLE